VRAATISPSVIGIGPKATEIRKAAMTPTTSSGRITAAGGYGAVFRSGDGRFRHETVQGRSGKRAG
jgi:hypothetical protein